MKVIELVRDPNNRLDIVAGIIDGILNALALAAGRLLQSGGDGATIGLALRVSIAAGATTVFVFFVAHYAQLRLELVRHERELNFMAHGRLAATALGRGVFVEALYKAMLAAFFSLAGALFPLILCTLLPSPPWLGLFITIVALGALGAMLAKTFYGSPWRWAVGLLIGGVGLALIGMKLNLVG
jgi:VIT1/CCC1 family predicted Fe2+/Mn2+ transporter